MSDKTFVIKQKAIRIPYRIAFLTNLYGFYKVFKPLLRLTIYDVITSLKLSFTEIKYQNSKNIHR